MAQIVASGVNRRKWRKVAHMKAGFFLYVSCISPVFRLYFACMAPVKTGEKQAKYRRTAGEIQNSTRMLFASGNRGKCLHIRLQSLLCSTKKFTGRSRIYDPNFEVASNV